LKLIITAHALDEIAKRRLDLAWVERVALCPEWIEPDPQAGVIRHFGTIAEFGGRILRVPVADRGANRHVLSAFFDRTARRRSP
jgi:hypothetical protein